MEGGIKNISHLKLGEELQNNSVKFLEDYQQK